MEQINKVKGYRTMVGLTQEEMAKYIDLAVRSYKEREINSNFTVDQLVKIKSILNEKGLKITLDDLI